MGGTEVKCPIYGTLFRSKHQREIFAVSPHNLYCTYCRERKDLLEDTLHALIVQIIRESSDEDDHVSMVITRRTRQEESIIV